MASCLKVGAENRAYVVAEMAWSHDGSVTKGKAIVEGASQAGADAINFHLTSLPDYMVPFYRAGPGRLSADREMADVYRYLDKINLPFESVAELCAHAREHKLAVSVLCNDEPSLDFAVMRLLPDILMIHPSSVGDERLLRGLAAAGRPLVIYTGGLRPDEIEAAVCWATAEGNKQIILQHGFQSYPTAIEENHLRAIGILKQRFGLPVAFADHTDGDDPMAMIIPLLAVAMGADAVEKHITFDRSEKGEDFESALDPAQFKAFVQRLRQAEASLGPAALRPLSERQIQYRAVVRKRAVAAVDIAAGATLTRDLIAFKRADEGLYPEEIADLFGRVTAAQTLQRNTPLMRSMFQ
jgi:sialic acid synthase SpsE